MAMSRAKIIKSVWREFTLVQALFVIFIGRKPATDALSTWRGVFEPSAKAHRGDEAAKPRNRG